MATIRKQIFAGISAILSLIGAISNGYIDHEIFALIGLTCSLVAYASFIYLSFKES